MAVPTPRAPRVGDLYRHHGVSINVTSVGELITWRVDGGTVPFHFNASPAQFARLAAKSIDNGAEFIPAP